MEKKLYETIIIYDPTITIHESISLAFANMCQKYTGTEKEIRNELIGKKTLAYEIKKHKEGYYQHITWMGTPENVAELERMLRINELVLKFMTLASSDDVEDVLPDMPIKSEQASKPQQENEDIDLWDLIYGD